MEKVHLTPHFGLMREFTVQLSKATPIYLFWTCLSPHGHMINLLENGTFRKQLVGRKCIETLSLLAQSLAGRSPNPGQSTCRHCSCRLESKLEFLRIMLSQFSFQDGNNSRQVHYGLIVLKVATEPPPMCLAGFTLIQQTSWQTANICRLVTVGDNAYIYNNDSVLAVCLQPGGVEDRITFSSGD